MFAAPFLFPIHECLHEVAQHESNSRKERGQIFDLIKDLTPLGCYPLITPERERACNVASPLLALHA